MVSLATKEVDQLCGSVSGLQVSKQWWVAHTKGRFEKAFARDLHARGIGFFLPLVEQKRFSGGRKRRVHAPLFPSYVFFAGDEDDRYQALATNRLCQVIKVIDQQAMVCELMALEKALASKKTITRYPHVAVGKRCRVRAGALKGVEGTVIQFDRATHLVLQVSMLGQGASLTIEPELLEPAD